MTREALLRATVTAMGMHNLAPDSAGVGLGWTARRAFMVHDAGIIATSKPGSRQPVTKDNNGWAIGAYLTNFNEGWAGSNWVAIITISTESDAAVISAPRSGSNPGIFQYLGLTWYSYGHAQNARFGRADYYDTELPEIDMANAYQPPNAPITSEIFLRIMEAAGVRRVPKRLDRPVLTAGR